MKKIKLLVLLLSGLMVQAQEVREKVQEGNKAFEEGAFDQAEIKYREALKSSKLKHKATPQFNLGDALYKQERWQEARAAFEASLAEIEDPVDKADAYHNLGNSLMKEEKLEEAIEAYKNALKNNPAAEDTRQNLAQALMLKKKQEQQKQDQKKDNKEDQKKDQKKDQDQEKDQKKDKQDQKQDQDKKQKDQDQQKNQDEKSKEGGAEQQKKDLNRENVERLLEALNRQEEETQKKVLRKKIKAKPNKSAKDWWWKDRLK